MRKVFVVLLLATVSVVKAQLSLQPNLPASGLVQQTQLWNLIVINSAAQQYQCRLDLILRDRLTNMEVLTATTNTFFVNPGAERISIEKLNPLQYNYIQNGIDIRPQGLLPAGNYTVCYSLYVIGGHINPADECIQFETEPLSPPMLVNPPDSSVLVTQPGLFSWVPPAPANMFTQLQYDVLIVPVNDNQTASEAIQYNVPFYSAGNQAGTSLTYPTSASAFEKDKWYAWQVVARDERNYAGKTETWVFKLSSADSVQFIEAAPYIKMKKNPREIGIAPEGVIKLSYINETSQKEVLLVVSDPADMHEETTAVKMKIKLKPGENLIYKDLKNRLKMQEGRVYIAKITNSRNEHWQAQFTFKKYSRKK
ncbi:MAG: hypothetical protein QM791_22445 [Ferruginibacter sp.]